MRPLRRVLATVVILAVAVYVLALGYLSFNEEALIFKGADLRANERLTVSGAVQIPWDTVRVTTKDGVGILLFESQLPNASDAPWIIYFHGNAGRLADDGSLARYRLFRSAGLNVLAVEYRGYGASEKQQPTEGGVYSDARAAWRHATEGRGVPASRVVLYGYSLGGGVATQLAAEVSPAGLITEATFTSAPAQARLRYPWVPAGLLMRNRFENLVKAASLSVPWLLFHGRQDKGVPFAHAEELARTTAGFRRLVPLRSGHNDALDVDGDRMRRALRAFVREIF